MPYNCEHKLLKDSDIIYDHPKMRNQSPVNVSESFKSRLLHMSAAPNCIGARWSYTDAIAKSVDELNSVILSGLKKQNIDPKNKDLFIKVTVKDGADGLGDISEYKQKSDTFLPTKAFRYTYAVLKCEAFVGEDKFELFVEESPNSIRCNRPLLQAICDENESSSMVLTL